MSFEEKATLITFFKRAKRGFKLLRSFWLRLKGVEVGKGSLISFGAWVDTAKKGHVTIGKNVIVSHGSKILAHDWASSRMGLSSFDGHFRHTVIEDDAFIGMNSVVLPGVTVGRGAIVGAGAIVTRDVSPYTVVVGNPAKKIKQYSIEGKTAKNSQAAKS